MPASTSTTADKRRSSPTGCGSTGGGANADDPDSRARGCRGRAAPLHRRRGRRVLRLTLRRPPRGARRAARCAELPLLGVPQRRQRARGVTAVTVARASRPLRCARQIAEALRTSRGRTPDRAGSRADRRGLYQRSKATNVASTLVACGGCAGRPCCCSGGAARRALHRARRRAAPDGQARPGVRGGGETVERDLAGSCPSSASDVLRARGRGARACGRRPARSCCVSPACSSYDMSDNYEQRGRVFKQWPAVRPRQRSDDAGDGDDAATPRGSTPPRSGRRPARPVESALMAKSRQQPLERTTAPDGHVLPPGGRRRDGLLGVVGADAARGSRRRHGLPREYLIYGAVGLVLMQLLAPGLEHVRRLTPRCCSRRSRCSSSCCCPASAYRSTGRRWLGAGPLSSRPAELMKLALVLHAAAVLVGAPQLARSLRGVALPFLLPGGCAVLLIRGQPDLGTALVIGSRSPRCSSRPGCRCASCCWSPAARRGPDHDLRAAGALPARAPDRVPEPVGRRGGHRASSRSRARSRSARAGCSASARASRCRRSSTCPRRTRTSSSR